MKNNHRIADISSGSFQGMNPRLVCYGQINSSGENEGQLRVLREPIRTDSMRPNEKLKIHNIKFNQIKNSIK